MNQKPKARIEFWDPDKHVIQAKAVDSDRRFFGVGDYARAIESLKKYCDIVEWTPETP